MDKACVVYDGYCVYKISSKQKAVFLVDDFSSPYVHISSADDPPKDEVLGVTNGYRKVSVPLFRIVKGIVRSSRWNPKLDADIEAQKSDYQCLQENIEIAKNNFKEVGCGPVSTTIVVTRPDTGEYGIGIVNGIVIGLVKD